MRLALLAVFLPCVFAAASYAAAPEDAYLAARDKYIRDLTAMEKTKASVEKVDAAHTKALADLEVKLRAIVGEVSVKGFSGAGKINMESLTNSNVGSGMLDAMVYSEGSENAPQLVVTTRYLLDKWLAAAAKEKDKSDRLPSDLKSALQVDRFYTSSIGSDAAFTRNANIEVTAPSGVELVAAVLGGWAQDIGPNPDYSLIVTLVKDGKVYIGSMQPKTAIGEIAACQTIWTDAQQRSEKMRAAAEAAQKSKKKVLDTSDDIEKAEEKADKDFHACFVERAPKEAFYPSLVKEAQQFADRIAGK
jgi:hypothetical protein